jgi:hypothetical protein
LYDIKKELKTAKHCAVYNEELHRVWPQHGRQRETEIARFASDHASRLRYYRDHFCASSTINRPRRANALRLQHNLYATVFLSEAEKSFPQPLSKGVRCDSF